MKCLECNREFKDEKGLHIHLRAHKMTTTEYYFKHFGRVSVATNLPIVFNGLEDYKQAFFNGRAEMRTFFRKTEDFEQARYVAGKMLENYMKEKNIKFIPCEFESMSANCPTPTALKRIKFDTSSCLFKLEQPPVIELAEGYYIDTREQQPFDLPHAIKTKLDIGDYAAAGKKFDNVFCDRKSSNDFVSTFSSGNERFKKEIERAVKNDAFLYVIIESSLPKLYKDSVIFKHQNRLDLALHNCRSFLRDYPSHIQFILAGDREKAEKITKYVLSLGKAGTKYDYQYLIKNELEPWT